MKLNLSTLPDRLSIWRLGPTDPIPPSLLQSTFLSITRTDEELSIVLPTEGLPTDPAGQLSHDWRCLKVAGPLDFSLVGILAELATILANASVSIFAISTYDTDYLMVKSDDLDAAISALRQAGHTIQEH